jgi:methionyl-tRNA formyltransferase
VSPARAVVFAYHDVGVRCLKALLSAGVDVPLVVTVADDPNERQWYASVAECARDYGLNVIAPPDAGAPELAQRVTQLVPDFLFSFYYRSMLAAPLLASARRGALNMHGSLLPRYRGRAPVNWAILRGERECGATLHYMVARADAGDIVDSQAVPILIDDDARAVYAKVTVAAEMVLVRSLPGLLAGTAPRRPQPILPGEYYGRRTPADGRIDWSRPALEIHNLVRAVAPPFPGAFAQVDGTRWEIHRTRLLAEPGARAGVELYGEGKRVFIACADGRLLELLAAADASGPIDLAALAARRTGKPLRLV